MHDVTPIQLRMKVEKSLKNVIFEVHDATNLPKEWEEKFDVVLSFKVIHDIGRPDLALRELHRVLKKGKAIFHLSGASVLVS